MNAADRVFKRMQPLRDHREKQQYGMLKQNGNERFYHSFLFPPVCQKPTPPTGREMNSPSAVIPESPLLFLIKTFLRLCSFFFLFLPPEEVWGWVNNLLLTGHTMIPYLDFTGFAKKKKFLLIVVWC